MAKLKTLAERIKNNELPAPAEYKTPEEVYEAYTSGLAEGRSLILTDKSNLRRICR